MGCSNYIWVSTILLLNKVWFILEVWQYLESSSQFLIYIFQFAMIKSYHLSVSFWVFFSLFKFLLYVIYDMCGSMNIGIYWTSSLLTCSILWWWNPAICQNLLSLFFFKCLLDIIVSMLLECGSLWLFGVIRPVPFWQALSCNDEILSFIDIFAVFFSCFYLM